MKRNSLVVLLLVIMSGSVSAQQDKLITHFMYDKMSLNPGETGIEGGICAANDVSETNGIE